MNQLGRNEPGITALLMGNEALARGVIESGAAVCAAYPGNPSSEIVGTLAKIGPDLGMHVEWSVNEKVALEVAAAAAMTGLRGMAAMKQNGLNVASDFLLNLNLSGVRGGLVVIVCDDPSGISSTNEQDTRHYARMGDLPLLEPSDFQEAKDMVLQAFELSEKYGLPVLVHSVTRLSHSRGNVLFGPIQNQSRKPFFDRSRPFINIPAPAKAHLALLNKIKKIQGDLENSPFNKYQGPRRPELLIVTTGAGRFYCQEAVKTLDLSGRVGIIKVGNTWPLPEGFLLKHLVKSDRIVIVEEGSPFLESNVKAFWADQAAKFPPRTFWGKGTGHLPTVGELSPDLLIDLLNRVFEPDYEPRPQPYSEAVGKAVKELAPERDFGFCAGCSHRASYWAIKIALALDGRDGFVLGDIGCYGTGAGPAGFNQMNTMQAMGSSAGLASGMGLLHHFGLDQPVVAVCGDSTFFHAAIPALINARQHGSHFIFLILDNSATAMTGFQPHAGMGVTATGQEAPLVDIGHLCEAIGLNYEIQDPYDLEKTIQILLRMLKSEQGSNVLILKRECALVRIKNGPSNFKVEVKPEQCLGDECGCNRLCTRVFRCPGLFWDAKAKKARIDEAICMGCGVCVQICPTGAIVGEAE